MKKNYFNIIFVIVVCILCVIFVDLIFNFSSIVLKNQENFIVNIAKDKGFVSPDKSPVKNSGEIKNAKSIMSEDGSIFNIEIQSGHPDETDNHMNTRINASNGKYIGIDENGHIAFYNDYDDKARFTWSILKIAGNQFNDLYKKNIIPENNANPFHIIYFPDIYRTSKKKLVLAKNNSNTNPLVVENLSYEPSQRWWVHDQKASRTRDESGLISASSVDPNKLNIKLNIKDPELKQFIKGLRFGDESLDLYDDRENCEYIHRDTIENGCAGCDTSKLPLVD